MNNSIKPTNWRTRYWHRPPSWAWNASDHKAPLELEREYLAWLAKARGFDSVQAAREHVNATQKPCGLLHVRHDGPELVEVEIFGARARKPFKRSARPVALAPIVVAPVDPQRVTNSHVHREAWLHAVASGLAGTFASLGHSIPGKVRLACGFPSRAALNGVRNQRIGECWSNTSSGDDHFEIFISPVIADPMRAAGVLAHELCHAAVGVKAGHKGPFAKLARALGLEGKLTATTEGEAFKRLVTPILEAAGPYPHAELHAMTNGRKKQVTRLIKCECATCGYVVRTAQSWIDEKGAPHCPEHGEMAIA
jgi:hypothetical protein